MYIMELIRPAYFVRDDYCDNCDHQNTIEIYNFFGKPLGFSNLVNERLRNGELSKIFDKEQVYIMKCTNCNKRFKIDWTDGYPRPMRVFNRLLREFQINFIDRSS